MRSSRSVGEAYTRKSLKRGHIQGLFQRVLSDFFTGLTSERVLCDLAVIVA